MDLIGKTKLTAFLKEYPDAMPAVAAWLKELSNPPENHLLLRRTNPSMCGTSPYGKFHINYRYNPLLNFGYIIYIGKEHKGIPAHVTMPEMEETLIRVKITIITEGRGTKEIREEEEIPNHLRDVDYPIPKAEAGSALQAVAVESLKKINTESEYKRVLYRAFMIFDSDANTKEHEELLNLLNLIINYENEHCKFPDISPVKVLKMRLDEMGYSNQMLAEDVREPIETVEAFLQGGPYLSKKALKKISRIFKVSF